MFEKTSDVTRRLNQWRELRHNATSEEEVLEAFSQVKILPRYLDYWTPSDWPNAFEILEHGYFCATGIAILLYQTLGNLKYLNQSLLLVTPFRLLIPTLSILLTNFDILIYP